ncbi:MAG TPA: hypothetical protein VGD01_01895 [Candidatus Elarobacter sp.]|jgi:hypothetical protein
MLHGRFAALALAATFFAGCSGGGGSAPAPPATAVASTANVPSESSAARYILASAGSAGTTRAPQRYDGDDDDDGGWSALQLPLVRSCANGTFATDCGVWVWTHGGDTGGGTRSAARAPQSAGTVAGTPPVLNFCSGAPGAPFGYAFASPLLAAGPSTFGLSYTGTHAPPIVSFATRWWNVSLQGTFTGTSTLAPQIAVTPTLTGGASRGWLVFFTWSWPADILLVPYAIDEIQLVAGSSPLAVPRNGSATLGAFDCLGRGIVARRSNASFGFSPNLRTETIAAPDPLSATVFGGSNPGGTVSLSDDRGARTSAKVVAAPSPAPGPR